jgi:hypothetical protein
MFIRRGDRMVHTGHVTGLHISRDYPIVEVRISTAHDSPLVFMDEDAWAWWLAFRLHAVDANNLAHLRQRLCGSVPTDHTPQIIEWQQWSEAEAYRLDWPNMLRDVPVYAMTRCHECGFLLEPKAILRTEKDHEDLS